MHPVLFLIHAQGANDMRLATLIFIAMLSNSVAFASESAYVMNFDLNILSPDGEVGYNIQLQGIRLSPDKPFHGDDLGEYDYFLTVSRAETGKAKLTIEFYEYASRRKTSDVVAEIIAEVDVVFGSPARFEGMSDTFGINLAFSIVQE